MVKNRFIFRTCISRSRVRFLGDRLTLELTGGNWARLNEADSDTTALANTIKERKAHLEPSKQLASH